MEFDKQSWYVFIIPNIFKTANFRNIIYNISIGPILLKYVIQNKLILDLKLMIHFSEKNCVHFNKVFAAGKLNKIKVD